MDDNCLENVQDNLSVKNEIVTFVSFLYKEQRNNMIMTLMNQMNIMNIFLRLIHDSFLPFH